MRVHILGGEHLEMVGYNTIRKTQGEISQI